MRVISFPLTVSVAHSRLHHSRGILSIHVSIRIVPRYLTVLYYQPNKVTKKMDLEKKRAELEALKARHGVDGSTPAPMKKASA